MERVPAGIYTQEFRAEAVNLVRRGGLTVREVARRLSLPLNTLKGWLRAERQGKLSEIGQGQKVLTAQELELARLRKELAETKLERDFLKKCAAYFVKESR